MRVPDIISTLPLAKVAKLAPTAEAVAAFDPAGAVVNNPDLLHKIMSMNVHGELLHAQARFILRNDLLCHIGQPPHTNLHHLPEWCDRPQLSNMWRVFMDEMFDSDGYAAAMGFTESSQQPDDDQEDVDVSAAAAADPDEEEESLPPINLDGTHYEVL